MGYAPRTLARRAAPRQGAAPQRHRQAPADMHSTAKCADPVQQRVYLRRAMRPHRCRRCAQPSTRPRPAAQGMYIADTHARPPHPSAAARAQREQATRPSRRSAARRQRRARGMLGWARARRAAPLPHQAQACSPFQALCSRYSIRRAGAQTQALRQSRITRHIHSARRPMLVLSGSYAPSGTEPAVATRRGTSLAGVPVGSA